jgi:DNA excision repair protein ERCC-4
MIVVDTREQTPYLFDKADIITHVDTLPIGDYSIQGFQDRVAVERKTLDDLVGCLVGKNRDRFERELQKGRYLDLFVVVVEDTMNENERKQIVVSAAPGWNQVVPIVGADDQVETLLKKRG